MRVHAILLVAVLSASGAADLPQDSRPAPSWAEVIERAPDRAIVTRPELRSAIEKTGLPWRVRHKATGIELVLVPPGTYMRGKSPNDLLAEKSEVPAH